MATLDHDKMHENAHQPLHGSDMVHSGAVNGKRERVDRRQRPTIGQFVYTFLDNIKLRFGERSTEVITILNILGTFRAGEMSKKDTLVAIRVTLGDHTDLKQDLLNILFHREADWGVGDFDFGFRQPLDQPSPSPQFLQPAHQPQMRLPQLSPPLIDSGLTPICSLPVGVRAISPPWHNEWQQTDHLDETKTYYSQPWSSVPNSSMLGRTQSLASSHFDSPALSHETPDMSPRKQHTTTTASPSVLGVPVAVPIGQPIEEMPPPSKKRRRVQSSGPQAKAKEEVGKEDAESASRIPPTTETADEVFVPPQSKKKVKEESAQSQGGGGPYIHSLCGKGFSSRSGVKKHHWGNKLDNLETTTGCWAKNNKPSVSWNEHPSCRERVAQRKAPSKRTTLDQKGLVSPSMVPGSQELQQPFTNTSHLRRESEQSLEGHGSYHSHRLPTRTSFDNLLTAVNVASQIEAPTPQGRIDSVVSHLDAQAAAAEHNRQYITNWQDASDDREEEALAYGRQHPYTAHGLGLQGVHVPVPMALLRFDRSYPHTSSSYNLTDSYWRNEHSLVFDDAKEHRAALGSPFSPDADMRYRQT